MGTFGNHAFSDLGRQEHVGCQAVAGRMDIVGQENTGGQEDLREDCGRHCCPDIWLHHRGRIGANRGWIALYCDGVEKRGGGGLTKGQSAETICLNFKYKKKSLSGWNLRTQHYPTGDITGGLCEYFMLNKHCDYDDLYVCIFKRKKIRAICFIILYLIA